MVKCPMNCVFIYGPALKLQSGHTGYSEIEWPFSISDDTSVMVFYHYPFLVTEKVERPCKDNKITQCGQ